MPISLCWIPRVMWTFQRRWKGLSGFWITLFWLSVARMRAKPHKNLVAIAFYIPYTGFFVHK